MDITSVFIIAIITLTFQVLGFGKYKIFLMFSVFGYVTLLVEYSSNTAMVIMFAGLILFNSWYATIGSRLD